MLYCKNMAKKIICFTAGGHIATQNASFRRLAEILGPQGYEFYGAEDGFNAFETGRVYRFNPGNIPREMSGFFSGAGRYSLKNERGEIDENKLERADDFFRKGKFDIAVGSVGDDHGLQMQILHENLDRVKVYALNKTIDNDLGGVDDVNGAPYTDFTNGFHSAVMNGVQMIHQHIHGAWTNNLPYLVSHFSRDANWTGIALAYWGLADKIIYGELPDDYEGHSVEKIHQIISEAQSKNENRYGRRFAIIIVPESTKIKGVQHESAELIDPHGHRKLQPELLINNLKVVLEKGYKLKTQAVGITYEMRNFKLTNKDLVFAERSAEVISDAILRRESGLESVFKIRDDWIEVGTAPIEKVSEKRYARYYPRPLIDKEKFEVTKEIGIYYRALFGERRNIKDLIPRKPKVFNVYG